MRRMPPGPGMRTGRCWLPYRDGRLDTAGRWSVEAHLTSCAACRLQARALVDPARLRRLRATLVEAVDVPRTGMVERLLVRLGVADHTARLLAATPALRGSWLLAVAATLAFAVLAAWVSRGPDATLGFLCVAPLLPLAGIAVAYGPGIDPTYEIGLAAPLRSLRLLLLRAATVLGTSTLLAAAASLALPRLGWGAAAWLLPSLGLTACSLALATTVEPLRAIGITAGAWVAALVVTVAPRRRRRSCSPWPGRSASRPWRCSPLAWCWFAAAASSPTAASTPPPGLPQGGCDDHPAPTVLARDLTMTFGRTRALDSVSFGLVPGVTGLLGPNGAGKTTLLRALATVSAPDSGSVQALGLDPGRTDQRLDLRGRVGYMPQEPGFHARFTAFEFVDYVAILKELHQRRARHQEVRRVLELVGLGRVRGKQIKALSGGMRRRVALAQALLGDPDLLVLDEPTAGLDPEQRLRFRELVSRLGEGRTVLLSTHQTEDVVALAQQVLVLHLGRLRFAGTPLELAGLARGHVWHSQERDPGALAAWRTGTGQHRNIGNPRQAPPCWSPPWRTATCCSLAGTRSRSPRHDHRHRARRPLARRRFARGRSGRGPLPPVHVRPGGGRERAAAAPPRRACRDRPECVAAVAVGQGHRAGAALRRHRHPGPSRHWPGRRCWPPTGGAAPAPRRRRRSLRRHPAEPGPADAGAPAVGAAVGRARRDPGGRRPCLARRNARPRRPSRRPPPAPP